MKNISEELKVTKKAIEKIHQRCMTCKKFSPTPPRPVVSLPAATEFNQVLTMDLKEVKVLNYQYILHMIDRFTRLGVSVFIHNKKPETIVHNLMKHWVSVGYGTPCRIWTDVGGEFCNETLK